MKLSDDEILKMLKQGKKEIIKYLFDLYYDDLCIYAYKLIEKQEIAEEVVQDIFIYCWEKRNTITIKSSIKNYLSRAVKNQSINYLKSKYANLSFEEIDAGDKDSHSSNANGHIVYNELSELANEAIKSLPERCGLIFRLSRTFGLTYKEIAEQLNISVKTVENQMIIALKRLREYLDTHW